MEVLDFGFGVWIFSMSEHEVVPRGHMWRSSATAQESQPASFGLLG